MPTPRRQRTVNYRAWKSTCKSKVICQWWRHRWGLQLWSMEEVVLKHSTIVRKNEIQTYEEDNFVRLPTSQTKKSFKEKQRDIRNQFAGEDWSMFNNNKDVTRQGTSRKRKATTVWDKVKKRRILRW